MREGCIAPWQFMCIARVVEPLEGRPRACIETCGFRSCDDNLHYCDHAAGNEGDFMRFIDIAMIL